MSWQAMDAIDKLPYDACKEMEFRVLTKLANVAGQDGTRAWRFIPEMADELGVNARSIQRALSALQEKNLIRKGDQRAVAMWRGDRRPTVFDINMGAAERLTAVQEPLPDEVTEISTGSYGVTEISTGSYGVTDDTTTAVPQKELRKLLNSTTQDNQTEPVAPSRFVVSNCPIRGRRGHLIDPTSGYCTSCGTREDVTS